MRATVKSPVICFLVFALFACADDHDKRAAASQASDSSHAVVTETGPEAVVLKDIQIDAKTVTGGTSSLKESEISSLSIRSIDSAYMDAGGGFKYFVVDTLYQGASVKVLLIARQYAEENIAWATSYDQSSRLLDKLQVYYDNSEGNLLVTSSINDNVISVNTENIYSETPDAGNQKQVYSISQSYKFVKK